jgi:exopolysaccharide production protein ExoQ
VDGAPARWRTRLSPRTFFGNLGEHLQGRPWVPFLVLVLIVACEYDVRARSDQASLEGSADIGVLIEVVAFGIVAAVVVALLSDPPRFRERDPLLVVMGAFTCAMVLAATYSPYLLVALVRAAQLVITAGFVLVIRRRAEIEQFRRLCHWFIVVLLVSIAAGIAVPLAPRTDGRFSWFYFHPNGASVFAGLGVVITVALLLRARTTGDHPRWRTEAYILALVPLIGALVAAKSRGVLFGTVVGCVAVAVTASRRKSRLDLVVAGTAAVAVTVLLFGADIGTYLRRGDSDEQIRTLNSRTELWEQGFDLWEQRRALGYGFMSARGLFLETFGLGDAHNAFLEVLVNSGLLGTPVWLLLLFLVGRDTARVGRGARGSPRHPDAPILIGVFWFLVASSFTDGGLGQSATVQSIWLLMLVAWLGVIARDRRVAREAQRSGEPLAPVGLMARG